MQFLLDHLSSILVGTVVVLGIPLMTMRSAESSRDATRADAARSHLMVVTEVMAQDFANVGAGVDLALPVVVAWEPGTTAGASTAVFEFRGAIRPTADAPVERVRYEVVPVEDVTVETDAGPATVTLHRVARSVWDGARHVPSGGTAPNVVRFDLDLLRDGVPLGPGDDPQTADALAVELVTLVSPTGRHGATYARWQTHHTLVNVGGALASP